MKKIPLLTTIAFFIASISYAQINKGSVLLGGQVNFNSQASEFSSPSSTIKTSSFSISPSVGLAIRQNLIIGAGLIYQHVYNGNPATNVYGGNIFLRKYLPLGKNFYLFGESLIYFSTSKNELQNTPTSTVDYDYITTGLNFYPGVSYAVNRKIHLEIAMNSLVNISYSRNKITTIGNPNVQTNKNFNIGINTNPLNQLTIGFQFLLAK